MRRPASADPRDHEKLGMDIVAVLHRPFARFAVHRVLTGRLRSQKVASLGRFTSRDIKSLLQVTWDNYRKKVASLALQPTIGSTINLRLACFTMSFFDALLATDVERDYAIELVADTTWWFYRKWAWIAIALAHATPGKKVLGFATVKEGPQGRRVVLRFPFNAPGYRVETLTTDGTAAFNVVHCPVASYFRGQDAVDLCLASWCNLDYALAEMTEETLIRTKTLVDGHEQCDFRVIPGQAQIGRQSQRPGTPTSTVR